MTTLPRLVLRALGAMAICTAGYGVYAAVLADSDSPTLGETLSQLFGEMRRGEHLGAEVDVVRQRMQAKQEVVREVIAGRMSLREAMEYFRSLHDGNLEDLRLRGTDEERLAENVVRWVEAELRRDGGLSDGVLPRLRAELAEVHRAAAGKRIHAVEAGELH